MRRFAFSDASTPCAPRCAPSSAAAPSAAARPALPFGLEAVDGRLAGGGLAPALHEAAAAAPAPGDDAAATLFLAALAARFSRDRPGSGQVLWALTRRDLFAPGLAQAGLTPDRLLYAECRDDAELLAVMEEGVRHGSLAAVIGEVGRADMAATRRLQLAAEEGGTAGLAAAPLAEGGRRPARRALRRLHPLADRLRAVLASAVRDRSDEGLGRARWRVALVRQRGGPPHHGFWRPPMPRLASLFLPASGDRPDRQGGEARRAA